jgi:hypothetical protein
MRLPGVLERAMTRVTTLKKKRLKSSGKAVQLIKSLAII